MENSDKKYKCKKTINTIYKALKNHSRSYYNNDTGNDNDRQLGLTAVADQLDYN